MVNTSAYLAASFGVTFAVVFTVICTLIFSAVVVCFWWVDVKKKPLKQLFAYIKKGLWTVCEKVGELFTYNNTVKTVYSDKSLNYSGTEFLPIPTKAPTNQYTYEFVGWDKNGVDEKGNIVVRAIYLQKVIQCYINVFDDDKTTLLKSAVCEYGAGVNLSDLHPTKPDSKEFSYEFVGWDKETTAFYKNENVYAVYNAIPKKYTYKFVEEDGETIISQGTAIYGTPITPPSAPNKISKGDGVYEFASWKGFSEGMLLTKDSVFVAEYVAKPVGGLGSSSIIKTDGEKIRVVPEIKLTPDEDSEHDEIQRAHIMNAMAFDNSEEEDTASVAEIKVGNAGVIRKKQGMLVQRNRELSDAEKFSEMNKSETPINHDKDIHQKIQLMTVKKTTGANDGSSNVIAIKPKPEKAPEDDEILKNMMINKIKIDKK